ncbi:putative GH25 family protein [Mesocricetibacter intestinalis]|uniref:Putative GH25 family protein n=1 Tax=Mesocricetibacter intestinalis TaxID=1521930 RepID=A0A4R6VF39_9PAST|nr:DUF4198 domain-containing protein [Mesocricetibacter intestinalis]TDQ59472.1 putative GH25 family protein [Mesocricetibacter intestinalis]
MKKLNRLLPWLLLGVMGGASAHSLWTLGENKEVFEADIIYGHAFPQAEQIAPKRLSLFEPLKLVSKEGTVVLTQSGENYHYIHKDKLGRGTHILLANYKPTYWTQNSKGKWKMGKNRKDIPAAQQCGLYSMQAKSFVSIDDDGEFATQPLGQGYEITPLRTIKALQANRLVKFKVTHNGVPLQGVKVVGAPGGFDPHELNIHAFSAVTDANGEFSFKALVGGMWYLAAKTEQAGKQPEICEKEVNEFTLSFAVQ